MVAHLQADISQHLFLLTWTNLNLRSQTPDNSNLFAGLGYRQKSWWLEGMAWKQWGPSGGLWGADVRFRKQFGVRGKTVLYFEPAPLLSQKGFYWFLDCDTEVWNKFSVGAETENINRPGPDAMAVGPRISRSLGRIGGFDVSGTLAFRFDPLQHPGFISGHPHEIRLYLIFSRRFALTDRK